MKIADVTSFYSQRGGGIRTYLREKSRRLVARGHQVHRIIPGERSEAHRAADGAIEHTLAGPPMPFDRNYRFFGSLPALGDLLHQLAPDVVEVGSHYVLPWRIRELAPPRTRVVGFFHSNVPETFAAPAAAYLPEPLAAAVPALAWRIVRAMHARYDATLCASYVVEDQLREHEIPNAVRVGLGVDPTRFPPRRSFEVTRQVCYLGRLSRDKEAELLLRAAPDFAAAGITLVVAGDGPLASRFAACRDLRYLGPLPQDRLAELLRSSDACLVPGRYETFSFAAAEALACCTPVIAPDQGAAAELVQRAGCGELFSAGDPTELVAAAIRSSQRSRAARRTDAVNARTYVERELSWDAVVDRLLKIYRGKSRPLAEAGAGLAPWREGERASA